MAKYLHITFEMFDFRDEAIQALTPKVESVDTDRTPHESWNFQHLDVSRAGGVTHVQFKPATTFDDSGMRGLRDDFTQFADKLGRNNKVLLDFTGVESLSPGLVDVLVLFDKRLRAKGSRIALCCLDPASKDIFFATR